MRKIIIIGIAVFFVLSIGLITRSVWAEATPPYTISMQAQLFYTDSGTFSENIIDNPKYDSLWNTVIGEGSAGGPAVDLLVIVKIKGTPGAYTDRDIHLKATSGKTALLDRKSMSPILNDKGEGYMAFWIYDCTMSPLHLRAEVTGQSTKAAVYKVIQFESGE